MPALSEWFPFFSGVLIGLICASLAAPRWRHGFLIVLSVLFGGAATWLSGEAEVGWEYLAFDIALVAAAAYAALLLWRPLCRMLGRSP